ncbi:MAG TPA: hypothetical protein VMM85_04695 [Methylomirabilota bacterium]|nr:hypothetical protein [Methylomirabilota bacterium]
MSKSPEPDKHYEGHEPESFNQPNRISLRLRGWPRSLPFTIYVTKFKSGSPEAQSFFLDPLRWMRGELTDDFRLDGEPAPVSSKPLKGVHEESRVSSFIINHEATLRRHVIYTMTVVDSSGDEVGTTTYKEPPTSSG